MSTGVPALKNPVIFSLDVSSLQEADKWIGLLGAKVGAIKLGPRLVLQASSDWVRDVSRVAPTFIDCKFFDIPSTMEASIETCFSLGASIVTVHALVGGPTLKKLAKLESQLRQERPFLVTPVTILTSHGQEDLPPNFNAESLADQVLALAKVVKSSGLSSIVCSPHEAGQMKSLGFLPITPGVRLSDSARGDQKRVQTPAQAMASGAWALVVGRPLLQASDPQLTLSQILQQIVPS